MCVCVCVCERERKGERARRERDRRERDRVRQADRQRVTESEMRFGLFFLCFTGELESEWSRPRCWSETIHTAPLRGPGQTLHSCGGAQAKSLRLMWVNMSAQGRETWQVLPWTTTPRDPVFRPSNCVKYCACTPWRAAQASRQAFTFSTLWLIDHTHCF